MPPAPGVSYPPSAIKSWPDFEPTRLTDPIFASVYRASGLPGKPPPVFSDPTMSARGSAGEQQLYDRRVALTPDVVAAIRRYALGSVGRDRDSLRVLLHEYAHVNQPRVFNRLNPRSGIEPAADLWANNHYADVARRIGGPQISGKEELIPSYEGFGYPREAGRMSARRDSPQFVQAGQFGRPVTGVPTYPPPPPRATMARIPTLAQYLTRRERDRSGTRR